MGASRLAGWVDVQGFGSKRCWTNHMIHIISRRTFYDPEPSDPVLRFRSFLSHASLPSRRSAASRDRGIRTPTSVARPSAQPALVQPLDQSQEDALPRVPGQHPVDQSSSSPHDLTRHLDERRAVRRELHPQQRPSLGPCFASCRGDTGTSKAAQAFRLQAKLAITIYAQLLTKLSTGVVSACTPPLSWATRFSWSQRSLAENTTSSADISRSLVM